MKPLLCLLCLLYTYPMVMRAQRPELHLKDGSTDVVLDTVGVSVQIAGALARTEITLTFLNKSHRVLEGTLTFPMPEGITVSGFALDINGRMRDAVPVPKARATEVFESIQHRRVDPGLLEQVEGNLFRTRIYPFPAQGRRSIRITYDEILSMDPQHRLRYELPLDFGQTLSSFSLQATVIGSRDMPGLEERPDGQFAFRQQSGAYIGSIRRQQYRPERPLSIVLPKKMQTQDAFYEPNTDGSAYFMITDYQTRFWKPKHWAKHIDLIWDCSLSGDQRDHHREWALLEQFFTVHPDMDVQLKWLNHQLHDGGVYHVRSGDWGALKKQLQETVYDGATDFSVLHKAYARTKTKTALLFTDGIGTYGRTPVGLSAKVYTLIAAQRADHTVMKNLSRFGKTINLQAVSATEAVAELSRTYSQFMGIAEQQVREVYPLQGAAASGQMVITGLLPEGMHRVTLLFGHDGIVETRRTVTLKRNKHIGPELHRIWAQQKIAALNSDYEHNQIAISRLAQQFGLVSRNTSLIVLEDLADYVRYGIDPPEELMAAYRKLKTTTDQVLENRMRDMSGRAVAMFTSLHEWWQTDFASIKRYPEPASGKPLRASSVQFEAEDLALAPAPAPVPDREERAPARSAASADVRRTEMHMAPMMDQYTAPHVASAMTSSIQAQSLYWGEEQASSGSDGPITEDFVALEDLEYMQTLRESGDAYAQYLLLRAGYRDQAPFYYNVAQFFYHRGARDTALQILSNIAELQVEDAPLMKILVYKLKEWGYYEKERWCAKKVLEWRPMDPQSHRDYALALADNGQHQEALDSLYALLNRSYSETSLNRDEGLAEIVVMELNQLIRKHRKKLDISRIPQELIHDMPVDIRIVLNWNHMDTDIDLWVTQPDGERCMYSHPNTVAGGRISNDFTEGYGPEQYMLRKGIKGTYTIETDYFDESQFVLSGPTTVMAEIYLYYGSGRELRKVVTLQMGEAPETDKGVLIATFTF